MGDPSFLGIKLVDIAIFVVYTILVFTTGRLCGRLEEFDE